jgi:hypothetical protein
MSGEGIDGGMSEWLEVFLRMFGAGNKKAA